MSSPTTSSLDTPLPGNGPPQPGAPSSSPTVKEEGLEPWPGGPDPDVPGTDEASSACSTDWGVLSEEQIRKKKIRKQQQQESQSQSQSPVGPQGSSSSASGPGASPGGSEAGSQGSGEGEGVQLTAAQELMIQQLVAAQLQCNKRSFSDQPKVTPWPLGADPQSRDARQQRFAHFTELAIISVQEIVDFAKQVPGFLQLGREDQIALLKASTIEIMLLETARRYNHETECITFLKDFTYSKDDFHRAGLQVEFINPIFEFSRAMRRLGLDDAEYALLIAINIFSADRPNVQEPGRVEALQQPYVEALLSYTRIKRPQVGPRRASAQSQLRPAAHMVRSGWVLPAALPSPPQSLSSGPTLLDWEPGLVQAQRRAPRWLPRLVGEGPSFLLGWAAQSLAGQGLSQRPPASSLRTSCASRACS
nr:oxysterols receptor LXR-beta isoform X3 [Gorilla gorilla gorilla]